MNEMRIALPQPTFKVLDELSVVDAQQSVLTECNQNLVADIQQRKERLRTDITEELPSLSHISTGDFIAADLIGADGVQSWDSMSTSLSSESAMPETPLPMTFTPFPSREKGVLPVMDEDMSDSCSVGSERVAPPFIVTTPLTTTNLPQIKLTADVAKKILIASQAATNSFFLNSATDVFTNSNSRIHALQGNDYPTALRTYQLNNDKTLSQGAVHLRGYVAESENTVYLSFSGISNNNLLTDIKFILSSLRGRESTDLKNALMMVKTFQQAYPNKKIILTGHSMGGAFSSYCSIKTGLPAVNFNSMGLTRRLINSLRTQHTSCNIVQVNAHHDWLSQFVQKKILVQPGERFKMPGFKGHALYHNAKDEGRFMTDEMYLTSRGEA
ncbi:MAG: hypothetical protein ACRCZ6_17735 [Kluyvera sp.]|uniref:hypothetical protein n=1 Tax=Kluyvera sp. TaxID=1538228 RepID=UPI003F2E0DBC